MVRIILLNILLVTLSRVAQANKPFYYKQNILDYGAVANDTSTDAAFKNSQALENAFANQTRNVSYPDWPQSYEIVIPEGNFTFMPTELNFYNKTFGKDYTYFTIDGTVLLSSDWRSFPNDGNKFLPLFTFIDYKDLTVQGKGTVDGQGFNWWIREYLQLNPYGRPHMITFTRCQNLDVSGVRWLNSPDQNINSRDGLNQYFHDFEIYVDIWGQLALDFLLQDDESFIGTKLKGGFKSLRVPTFPLNTDGIDPSAKNVEIARVNITCFDDAVAVKPADSSGTLATCAENMYIHDLIVTWGVGMSLGTVVPHDSYNCIRNITFSKITFYHPFKAMYIKTNPGTTTSMLPGSGGEITNIVYEDIVIHEPIWWNIYIGPQQQKQPGGSGPGCMFYPLGGECLTQPLVTIANVTFRNIESHGGILPPGVLRGHETNPLTGIYFYNVKLHGIWRYFGFTFLTENVYGYSMYTRPKVPMNGSFPDEVVENNYYAHDDIVKEVFTRFAEYLLKDNTLFTKNIF